MEYIILTGAPVTPFINKGQCVPMNPLEFENHVKTWFGALSWADHPALLVASYREIPIIFVLINIVYELPLITHFKFCIFLSCFPLPYYYALAEL